MPNISPPFIDTDAVSGQRPRIGFGDGAARTAYIPASPGNFLAQMSHRKILVTGADGFIGSHLTEALVRAGHDVRAMVLYNSFNSWGWLDHCAPDVAGKFETVAGDVRDFHSVAAAMRGRDTVLHLAALIAIPYSYQAPASYVDTNVKGTLHVMQAAQDLGVTRVVHTSTSEVYGTARFVPITEDHPLQGQSPYSATKIGADHVALSYHASFATPVTVVRPFNTYGPRQSARAVIPTIITQIAAGARSIKLGALTPTRDFSYVDDTVSGFIAAMNSDAVLGTVVNLGSGFEISISDTAKAIAGLMGRDVAIEAEAARLRPKDSEVERLWAGTEKAATQMNWRPAYGGRGGFDDGLRKTIAWFTQPENLARYKSGLYNV